MKDKKGFTLTELLGVLTLIGIIAIIAFPTVDSIVKKSGDKAYEFVRSSIMTASRSWILDNKELFVNDGDQIVINLLDLKEQGYIDFEVKNPISGKCVSNDFLITITRVKTLEKNKYDVKVSQILVDGEENDCDATIRRLSLYLRGTNPMNVRLGEDFASLDAGAIAKDEDGNDISARITVVGDINTAVKSSNNQVKYTVTSGSLSKTVIRTVNVIDDEAPVIHGASDRNISSLVTDINLLDGVTVTDNSNEEITIKVKTDFTVGIPGEYYATYTASDSSGNRTSIETKITVYRET